MMNNYSQAALLKRYNDENREPFNKELFERKDSDLIKELKNIILSCQRDQLFVIKVKSFTLIEDYETINKMLYEYEYDLNKNKKKKRVNQYEFIDLKDSDVMLLIVTYFIKVKDKSQFLDVYILVPRIVNKYYYRISGNMYSAMYQIVDGSTYNNATTNSTSSNKAQNVTLKTAFIPSKMYKNIIQLKTTKDEEVKCVSYALLEFSKSFNVIKYFLARSGFYETCKFLGINCVFISDYDIDKEDYYTFKNANVYINVPKMIFDNDSVTQSFVYCLYISVLKKTTCNDMYTDKFWLESLGGEFSSFTEEKGYSVLCSIEGIYDIATKESIRLPEDYKKNIYCILRWMIREFSYLRAKDNLDVSTKRVRTAEYVASLYSMKLCQQIYRLSDSGSKVTLDAVRKYITTRPTFLIESVSRCKLINYRNLVNDLDSMTALKCTYKGISGIGDKSKESIPTIFRNVHLSQLGRIDVDSSPKSDPGMSGMLCPLVKLHNGAFSDFQEPNHWEEEFSALMDNYKAVKSMKEIITFKQDVLKMDMKEEEEGLNQSINSMVELIKIIKVVEDTAEIETFKTTIEEGGMFYYE